MTTTKPKTKHLNTYTYVYYAWLPSYGDFDIDDFDIKAESIEDAEKQVDALIKAKKLGVIKDGPTLCYINGVKQTKTK